jgi:ABC-type Fe3+ transport system substrate-binding protein
MMLRGKYRQTLASALAGAAALGAAHAVEARTLVVYQCLSEEEIVPLRDGFLAYWQETQDETVEWQDFFQPCGEIRATIELEARGNAVQADAAIMDIGDFASLAGPYPDLFKELSPPAINDPEYSPAVRESAERTKTNFVIGLAPYVIVYNTNRVKPEEVPQSWADLLSDRWKDRIGLGDPETTSGAHVPLWFIVKHLGDTVGSPFGREYYEGLGKLNPITAGSHGAIQEYVNAGELDVGILSFAGARTSAMSGNPVAAVLPVEGAGALANSIGMVADSKVPDIAEGFVSWVLTQQGQEAVYAGPGYVPVRSDVAFEPAPFPFDPFSPKIMPLDPQWVAENRAENIAHFREVIK